MVPKKAYEQALVSKKMFFRQVPSMWRNWSKGLYRAYIYRVLSV